MVFSHMLDETMIQCSDLILSQNKMDGFRIGDLLSSKGMNKKALRDYDYVTMYFLFALKMNDNALTHTTGTRKR